MAVEAQGRVDYSMPLRCMNYDVQEYLKQLKRLQTANDRENVYATAAERFSRLRKGDRLAPVYTICLYHGMEEWDGPLSLGDMMDFGEGPEAFRDCFRDYGFLLVRADRPMDYGKFRTSLREVLELLPYRKDKKRMVELVNSREAYRSLDRETMEVITVMTNNTRLMKDVRAHWEEEKDGNMCEALQGIQEDGIAIGMEKGISGMVAALRECSISDTIILQKLQEKFALTRQKAEEYLKAEDAMIKLP